MGPCACPYEAPMELLGRRHTLQIIWYLQQESPRRFTAIKDALQLNAVTLSKRLGDLEEAAIVSRTEFAETPPRVEYDLTEKGVALLPLMEQLCQWAKRWDPSCVETPARTA